MFSKKVKICASCADTLLTKQNGPWQKQRIQWSYWKAGYFL